MGRNYRGRSGGGTILCVTNGCQLRGRGPKVRCLARLGAHTKLDWARRVCVYFGVGITTAVFNWKYVNSRQADQASTEPRGTYTRGSMSVGGAIARGTAPVCPCLACLSPHTSKLTFRPVGQFRPKRQGRGWEGDGTVTLCVGNNWSGASVV